jgi:hypothetical protein
MVKAAGSDFSDSGFRQRIRRIPESGIFRIPVIRMVQNPADPDVAG